MEGSDRLPVQLLTDQHLVAGQAVTPGKDAMLQFLAVRVDLDQRGRAEHPLDQCVGERVLDISLNGAAEGPGTIAAISAGSVDDPPCRLRGQVDPETAWGEGLIDPLDEKSRYSEDHHPQADRRQ